MTREVRTVGVVGTGVIGAGWAALCLSRGLDVLAHDPGSDAEQRLRHGVEDAWPTLARLGLAEGASPDRLTFVATAADAVAEADFVQESGPEAESLKSALIRELDEAAAPDVPIASSSSGLMPSRLQEMCLHHPERVLVGHPFHPVHLIPLVEVVAGQRSSAGTVDRAVGFYAGLGKRPVVVRREVPGHVAKIGRAHV